MEEEKEQRNEARSQFSKTIFDFDDNTRELDSPRRESLDAGREESSSITLNSLPPEYSEGMFDEEGVARFVLPMLATVDPARSLILRPW